MLPTRAVAVAAIVIALAAASCGMPTPGPITPTPMSPTPSPGAPQSSGPVTPGSEPERFTPLIIRALAPDPIPVTGSDGKVHVVYELEVLNAAPRPAMLSKVEIMAGAPGGPVISTLQGEQIVALSILVGDYPLPPIPIKVISPGRTLLLVLEAAFDTPAAVPTTLSHRITADFGAFEPGQGDFATNNFPARSVETGGTVTIGAGEPEVIGPPLTGADWVAVNGCCGLSPHRGAMLPVGGRINGAERYAVDWARFDLTARPIVDLKTNSQATFRGDPRKNASYFTFGQPVLAVADGTVVTVVQDLPEAPPRTFLSLPVAELGGNHIVLRLRDGLHAFYGHLQTGSVTVKPGDVVQRGQQIAKAGNSGNTSESHMHFHLMDGPEPLTATNLPWVLDSFDLQGEVNPERMVPTGAGARTDQLPLMYTAIRFPASR